MKPIQSRLLVFIHYGPKGLDVRRKYAVNAIESGRTLPSVEISGIAKAIDLFSQRDDTKDKSISMKGKSYGVFFKMFTTALEIRVKAAVESAYFNSLSDVLDNSSS